MKAYLSVLAILFFAGLAVTVLDDPRAHDAQTGGAL